MEVGRPTWWALRTVSLVVLAVPAGEWRERYRQEFRAELYGMSRTAQLCHAAGLVAQAFALRSALGPHTPDGSTSREDVMFRLATLWGRVLCLLNQHRDEVLYSDDNEPYQSCVRCGRDLFIAPYPGGGAASGPGPSFGG